MGLFLGTTPPHALKTSQLLLFHLSCTPSMNQLGSQTQYSFYLKSNRYRCSPSFTRIHHLLYNNSYSAYIYSKVLLDLEFNHRSLSFFFLCLRTIISFNKKRITHKLLRSFRLFLEEPSSYISIILYTCMHVYVCVIYRYIRVCVHALKTLYKQVLLLSFLSLSYYPTCFFHYFLHQILNQKDLQLSSHFLQSQ